MCVSRDPRLQRYTDVDQTLMWHAKPSGNGETASNESDFRDLANGEARFVSSEILGCSTVITRQSTSFTWDDGSMGKEIRSVVCLV